MWIILCLVAVGLTNAKVGFSNMQELLSDVSKVYVPDIPRGGRSCYGLPEDKIDEVFKGERANNYLDMANLMEFVQTSSPDKNTPKAAINFFNVSLAAMDAGNTFVAQENVARALGILETGKRSKRGAGRKEDEEVWDAHTLFYDFVIHAGQESLKELLHVNKKGTLAFIIDTSSSMNDDLLKVLAYIGYIIDEQHHAKRKANYIVNTFSDPIVGTPVVFDNPFDLMTYVGNLSSRIGGDCEERTCYGMFRAIAHNKFFRLKTAAMYVFTDAGSKDCSRQAGAIIMNLSHISATTNFILFDSCTPTVDKYYVEMAEKSGGYCILLKNNGVYRVTDTVDGDFQESELIYGEHSDSSNSIVGQRIAAYRNKRNTDDEISNNTDMKHKKNIVVDTSVEKIRIQASVIPITLLSEISLEKPETSSYLCADSNLDVKRTEADTNVIIDVVFRGCPCTGNWTLNFPKEAETFTYTVQSAGEYIVAFKSYFVDESKHNKIANYAPCLGKKENLVIKLNQGEKVNTDSLYVKILGMTGNVVHWEQKLAADEEFVNTFNVKLVIPTSIGMGGFRVLLEGEVLDGTKFQRISTNTYYPSTSCLRLQKVDNYYALMPNRKTLLEFEVTNNDEVNNTYFIACSNTENYPVQVSGVKIHPVPKERRDRVRYGNPVMLYPREVGTFKVSVSAPSTLSRGKMVTVDCSVMTTVDEQREIVRLTEMTERL